MTRPHNNAIEYAIDSLNHYYEWYGIPWEYRKDLAEMLVEDNNLWFKFVILETAYEELDSSEDDFDEYLDDKIQEYKEIVEEDMKGMVLTEDDEI